MSAGAQQHGSAAEERHARALWSGVVEPGDGIAGALVATLGAERAWQAAADGDAAAAAVAGLDERTFSRARARWRPRASDAHRAVDDARRVGVRLVVPGDPEWPRRVDDLGTHAPIALWVRRVPALESNAPTVAIVGARAASEYGEHVAGELASGLAEAGVAVISGAAYGIDASAHRAALAAGGTTLAVLAGGADRSYPVGNTTLIDRIAEHGAVVSEAPCGTSPSKWRFLSRNRVIAALSDVTIVVEAGRRSGSLNTAGHAATLGRPLGAVPGPVTSAGSAGCHRLLREYDATCVTGLDDVRELLGFDAGQPDHGGGRTDDSTRVLDALSSRTARTVDEIARRCGMAPDECGGLLALLEMAGAAVRDDVGGWRRSGGAR